MTDNLHDLLTTEGERWRDRLSPDPNLGQLLDKSTGLGARSGAHRRWGRWATGPRVAGSALVAAAVIAAAALWLTGVFTTSRTQPLAGRGAGSATSKPPVTSMRPGFPPPFSLAVVGTGSGSGEEATIARGAVGKPVRVTVAIRVVGHRAGRIQRLDLIVGTPNAIAGAGNGPGAPGGYVGRRRNQVAVAHFRPGIPADGQQFTATFVVSEPGRYPIDGQMAVTYRDPMGHMNHASTGQQLGYLVITGR